MGQSGGVGFARLVLRVDRRAALAVLGLAAAVLLPLAGALVAYGLDVRVDDVGLVEGPDPEATLSLALVERDGMRLAAYVVGDARVAVGEAWPMPWADGVPAGLAVVSGAPPPLVPLDAVLVHPIVLGDAPVAWSLVPSGPPARGADAFEAEGSAGMETTAIVLLAASLPAVAVIAAVFADHEVRRHAHASATMAALGAPRLGANLVGLRGALVALAGGLVALATVLLLMLSPAFGQAPWTALLVAWSVPVLCAGVAAFVTAHVRRMDLLRTGAVDDVPGRRLAWLPVALRPLALGMRVVPVAFLAALLFVVDVGLPLGAAGVPASLAGDADEWILGADEGLVVGGAVSSRPADVLWRHGAVAAILAESVTPTLVDGEPAVVRGGEWQRLVAYHGLVVDAVPGEGEIVLGSRLADRLSVAVGDAVQVRDGDRAAVENMRVVAVAAAPGLLADEAFVEAATGRALAGLRDGEATLVRARPHSAAVEAAMTLAAPRIEIIALDAPSVPGGAPLPVTVTLVNMGGQDGVRDVALRIDGTATTTRVAVPAFSERSVVMWAIAPAGEYTIQVNPTLARTSGAAPFILAAQATDAGVHVTTSPPQSGSVRIVADLGGPELVATTLDASGSASLPLEQPGPVYVLVGDQATRVVRLVPGALPTVTDVWVVPPRPVEGQDVTVSARIEQWGTTAGTLSVAFHEDGSVLAVQDVRLGPGESRTVSHRFRLGDGSLVGVGERNVSLVDEATSTDVPARPTVGAAVQREVADRVLGDARRALGALAATAAVTSVAMLWLAVGRALAGRQAVVGVLRIEGSVEQAQRRIIIEGATIGTLGAALACGVAWALFAVLGSLGVPVLFGHVLPNPVTAMFFLQVTVGMGALGAVAAQTNAPT